MPLPESAVKERLSFAYVSAVAAKSGATCIDKGGSQDYGIDVQIQRVQILANGRYSETGHILFGQIKATTDFSKRGEYIYYDLNADSYNKLVSFVGGLNILIVLCLPRESANWICQDDEQLLVKKCCYWQHVTGEWTQNTSSCRVRFHQSDLFTPEVVIDLLGRISRGDY